MRYTPEENARILAVVSEAGRGERKIAFQLLAEELGRSPKAIELHYYKLKARPTQPQPNAILQAVETIATLVPDLICELDRLRELEKAYSLQIARLKAQIEELTADREFYLRLMNEARKLAAAED